MFNFDKAPSRYGTNSVKWDQNTDKELLPMWIADMEFPVPPSITEELQKKVNHGIYGYTFLSDRYYDAVTYWMKSRHGWAVEKEHIVYCENVVVALIMAVRAICKPGDDILCERPVYGPFYSVIKDNGCNMIETNLQDDSGYYTFDFEDFEKKITPKTTAFMLCSPHNPSGRVWSREELLKIAEICQRHNVKVICDEIHADFILEGKHTVFAGLNEWTEMNTITCTAPSKTFNLAAVRVANMIVKNPEIKEKLELELKNAHMGANCFVEPCLVGAYMGGAPWLEELLAYIKKNRDYMVSFIKERVPELKAWSMEGTYLLWLNCEALNMDGDQLKEFFEKECRIQLTGGAFFGADWYAWERVNLACPMDMVIDACSRIETGMKAWRSRQ